jgi:recombination protein RecA
MQAARLHIEALLRARRLDRTVTDAGASPDPVRSVPTGLPWLDVRLAGGWPCGETSEIVGPVSSGRTSLLTASLAAATAARGDVAALIDTYDTFDASSALAAGVRLDHLLWARGDPAGAPRPHVLLDRAVKAFGLVLEAGGFGVVALDLADVAPADLARLPFTTWRRLQRFVEGRDTVALVLTPVPVARSARGVTLELTASTATAVWAGESRRARRLAGLALTPHVRTARRLQG